MTDEPKIKICAGLPGLPGFSADAGKFPYPDVTTDLVKVLRERGIAISYQHGRQERQYASLNAADIWIPVIQVFYETLLALDGHLLAEAIIDALGIDRAKKSQLHVEYQGCRLPAVSASVLATALVARLKRPTLTHITSTFQ